MYRPTIALFTPRSNARGLTFFPSFSRTMVNIETPFFHSAVTAALTLSPISNMA